MPLLLWGCAARSSSLILDNDQYSNGAGDDRDYTQGVYFEQVLVPDTSGERLAAALLSPFRFLESLAIAPERATSEDLSFRIEQRIYTPADIFSEEPVINQRPYSAQLALFFIRRRLELDADPGRRRDRLSRLALGFGQTGDLAFGEPSQRWVHAILDEDDPVGWGNDLEAEPFVQLEWERRDRWLSGRVAKLQLEALSRAGFELGTVLTRAHAEVELRTGVGLPRGLRPWDLESGGDASGLFAFATFGGRGTLHDHSIEGSLIRDDWPLDAEEWIAAWRLGLVWMRKGFTVSYTFDRQQKEYDTEIGLHDFGRLQLGYAFQF